jgi:hypothetical protein
LIEKTLNNQNQMTNCYKRECCDNKLCEYVILAQFLKDGIRLCRFARFFTFSLPLDVGINLTSLYLKFKEQFKNIYFMREAMHIHLFI